MKIPSYISNYIILDIKVICLIIIVFICNTHNIKLQTEENVLCKNYNHFDTLLHTYKIIELRLLLLLLLTKYKQ